MSTNAFPRLMTYKQVGDLLAVSDRTIWTLVAQGSLRAVRFGRTVRIDPRDVEAFIEQSKTTDDERTISN